MNARLLHFSILLLLSFLLIDRGEVLAQRTAGKSRDEGRPAEVAPKAQQPSSDGAGTRGGSTKPVEAPVAPAPAPAPRQAETPVTPAPAPAPAPRQAETPVTPAPAPAPRPVVRTPPTQEAPSIADPEPRREPAPERTPRNTNRPSHDRDGRPAPEVTVDGGTYYPAPPVAIGRPNGFWIRQGIRFGKDVTLSSLTVAPDYSGYDFSELLKRPYDDQYTDIYVEDDNGDLMMSVWEDSEIMDIGAVSGLSDVIYIPQQEWSADGKVLLIPGHEYAVRTWDHHYANFLVTNVMQDRVSFDWTYQVASDDPDAVAVTAPVTRSAVRFPR